MNVFLDELLKKIHPSGRLVHGDYFGIVIFGDLIYHLLVRINLTDRLRR